VLAGAISVLVVVESAEGVIAQTLVLELTLNGAIAIAVSLVSQDGSGKSLIF
jgi:hypothetical protein